VDLLFEGAFEVGDRFVDSLVDADMELMKREARAR